MICMHYTAEQIRRMRRIQRAKALEREKLIGKPRAKSWGGKKTAKQDRRTWKNSLRER